MRPQSRFKPARAILRRTVTGMFDETLRSEGRAQARRRQILEAAEACFRARGFHAATIAEIAAAADLSVGQIYRFFENKEAIIEASANQQMDELLATVAEVEARQGAADAIKILLAKGIEKLRTPGMAALHLEVIAEASRNPRIGAIVREHDRQIREAISGLLRKVEGVDLPEDADCRAEFMCLVFEGSAARVIRNPDMGEAELEDLNRWLFARLLGEPESPPKPQA
jgi:AcrR family transcriptional regulator